MKPLASGEQKKVAILKISLCVWGRENNKIYPDRPM